MRFVRAALSFAVWLVLGWLWLMFVALVIGGLVAFTIEYLLVSASPPAWTGYLVSGLTLLAAALVALFSTVRTRRLGLTVLVWVLLIGAINTATALLTRFGVVVPRLGYLALADSSAGTGTLLVNGVALLAAGGLFIFIREITTAAKGDTTELNEDEAPEA